MVNVFSLYECQRAIQRLENLEVSLRKRTLIGNQMEMERNYRLLEKWRRKPLQDQPLQQSRRILQGETFSVPNLSYSDYEIKIFSKEVD